MRRSLSILIVSSFVMASPVVLLSQWVQTNGPWGGDIRCFAFSGNNLFCGTNGGIYLSTNNGTTWTATNSGLTSLDVRALCAIGANIVAGTEDGLFLSSNNGGGWIDASVGLNNRRIRALGVSGRYVYAGTFEGVYRSADTCMKWTKMRKLFSSTSPDIVTSLAIIDTSIFAGDRNDGVYRSPSNAPEVSVDNTDWSSVNNGLTNPYVNSLLATGSMLFAGTDGGVFLSKDGGRTWSAGGLIGESTSNVFSLFVSGSTLFAATYPDGVYFSTNNGTSWARTDSLLSNKPIHVLAGKGVNLFAGTDAGVFLSKNNSSSWTAMNVGLDATTVVCLTGSSGNLFAGTSASGVFLSTDNGTSWSTVNDGLPDTHIYALYFTGRYLYAATPNGGIFVSTWFRGPGSIFVGSPWTEANSGLPGFDVSAFAAGPAAGGTGTNLFAGTLGSGVFLSTDNGTSWKTVNTGLTSISVSSLLLTPNSTGGMNLFAGTSAGVFLSTNNGANWTKKYGPTDVASFAVTTNTLGVVTLYAGAFRSTDAGTNWTQTLPTYVIVDGRSVMPTCKALLSNNNNLFIGSLNYGVLMTSDDYHFTPANEGFFPLTTVNALSLNGTVLFAGTSDAGVWKRSLAQMTTAIGRPDAVYPLQFTLEQNYPNPFNPSTAISFQLSAASFVSLRVYDMLGKQVATLVSQELQAGYYSTKWMADVPSGVYLYRIEAIETGNTGKRFVETRKMILLR